MTTSTRPTRTAALASSSHPSTWAARVATTALLALAALAAGACGSDSPGGGGSNPTPAATLTAHTLSLNSLNQSDIRSPGQLRKDEGIGQGSGNAWDDFVDKARTKCGGDPVLFEVAGVTLRLDTAGSTNAKGFEDVFSGEVVLYFADNSGSDDKATRVEIATVDKPTGVGPVKMAPTAASLAPLHARMVGGDFRVGLIAATTMTDKDDFSLDIAMSIDARAFCAQ